MEAKTHHIIVEGAELSGKSFLISQMYNFLEKKYNQSRVILNGCHWINADVGIFGTPLGKPCVRLYAQMLKILSEKNVIFEKFHISDIVYNQLYHNKITPYDDVEKKLKVLRTKIIFPMFPEKEKLIQKRLRDRLKLYPHYKRIVKSPRWYIRQQRAYQAEIQKSLLPHISVEVETFPDARAVKKILRWMGENI